MILVLCYNDTRFQIKREFLKEIDRKRAHEEENGMLSLYMYISRVLNTSL